MTIDLGEAPGGLALIERLVNTRAGSEDALDSPGTLAGWLEANGLPGGEVGAADLERAVRLREGLRELLLTNHGPEHDPSLAAAKLDALAREAPLLIRFQPTGEAVLEPAGRGAAGAIAKLLAIVTRAQVDGTWTRMKACSWETCQFAFYDRSRNRSRTWCDMSTCGNRAKARSYRARHEH